MANRKKTAAKGAANTKNSKKKKGSGYGFITFVLVMVSLFTALIAAYKVYDTHQNNIINAALADGTFFEGTWIDGIDVSGMTPEYALAYWKKQVEPQYSGVTVEIDGMPVTAADLGYKSNFEDVIAAVYRHQRTGTPKAQYNRMLLLKENPSGTGVTRTYYDEETVKARVTDYAKRTDSDYTAPTVTGFDISTKQFSCQDGSTGRKLNKQKLYDDIIECIDNGGGSVSAEIEVIKPEMTAGELAANFGVVASAVTNASSSSSARINNIGLALTAINGTRLDPGEEFSFNGTVGQRTKDRGYKPAAAYSSGEVIEEYGGGICQVSTTLFNAVAKSDLEVTERHNHSIPVSYVDKGKDATVCWNSQDFKFKNSTEYPIYIIAELSSDKRVHVDIYGLLLPDGMTIKVEAELTETVDFEIEKEPSPFLAKGEKVILKEGRTGYKAQAYKLYYDRDGNLIDRVLLCKSVYPAQNRVVQYGE